jgi:hypothetical protein
MTIKRTLVIDKREITKPSVTELRSLLRAFKKDVDNTKAEDNLFDFIDSICNDNETMLDYIVNMNRNFAKIEVRDEYI